MRNSEDIHDEWLVLRCQEGDSAALTELVDRWQPRLWRHAMRLTLDRDTAGDVVQQAWLAIIRGLNRLTDAACFRRWAYRIVTHKCADWIRQRQHERSHITSLAAESSSPSSRLPTAPGTAKLEADSADDVAILRRALLQLSPDHRAALSMFYLEQMSLAEISLALALPVGTVKSRLHYARQQLKTILERSKPCPIDR